MTIRAAGAVLWRRRDGRLEVAVVHRPRHDDWTIPKGKLDGDESDVEAARREILEETGFSGVLGPALGEVRYRVAVGDRMVAKHVRYWAMEATAGGFAANSEVDELRWVSPEEALTMLTYDLDRGVLRRFLARSGTQVAP
jgi:8-oxo-dGTP diphosphatase